MILDRMELEKREYELLSPLAQKSDASNGREYDESPCQYRTEFQRDRDRILHSKAFRRLKHKTQVFLSPEGDHYRTRLTHTLEVSQIARTIARALAMNEDLTEAIALGHDLGHTPFGHCGEEMLNQIHEGGFKHNVQSHRVVSFLEDRDKNFRGQKIRGLNLTDEVLDGILHHSGDIAPRTLEGQIVHISDRIAYINHDIDDAIRAGIMKNEDIPTNFLKLIGKSHSDRINNLIDDLIFYSNNCTSIKLSPKMNKAFMELREFMFEHVYLNPAAKKEENKAREVVKYLYEYFCKHPEKMPTERVKDYESMGNIAVKDYIAGMSDRYALSRYEELLIPTFWQKS